MGNIVKHEKNELKKHAAIIHCSNTLSLLQRKISNALLYHAYPELMSKEEHVVTVKQLCNIIGYYGNNYLVIKEALKALIATVVEWNIIDDKTGEEDWTASSIISSVRIKGSLCYFSYSPRMKELLYSPTMYGKINLIIQAKFKSSYGLALYENCIRYKGLQCTKWFEIDVFRKLMGVGEGLYQIFRDFKKRIVDKAVDEVNTYSDIIVEAEFGRVGRKVEKIRFKLKERVKKPKLGVSMSLENLIESSALTTQQQLLMDRLANNFGFSSTQSRQIIGEFAQEYIAEKVKLVESMPSYQQGKIENLAGYLLKALKEDYRVAQSSKAIIDHAKIEKQAEEGRAMEQHRKEELCKNEYDKYTADYISTFLSTCDEENYKEILGKFEEKLQLPEQKFILDKYKKAGIENKIVKAIFHVFIKEQYKERLVDFMEYDEFSVDNAAVK